MENLPETRPLPVIAATVDVLFYDLAGYLCPRELPAISPLILSLYARRGAGVSPQKVFIFQSLRC